jgi:2-aminoethylphosphonate-pyruvate transaminase
MVKTAVILAAGMGTRLRERTKNQPKGLLVIDEKPIVEQSICKLIETGIERIVIGTGYLAEAYERLALQYPQIKCVRNHEYEKTGSMYTLYNLKDHISGDIFLLESDLIYEKNALDILIKHKEPDVIVASELTGSNDEVFIETDEHHMLVNMSKKRTELNSIYAELVGITKISYNTFQAMCNYAAASLNGHPTLDYEYALVGISKNMNIYVHKLNNFAWCEIDDEHQLLRAKHYIYPIIKAKETVVLPVKRNILLNPGPATTTDTVKYAQVVPDICPREEEFGDVMQFISNELTRFVGDPEQYTAVLFGGSGTAAVESILSSVIGEDAVLIVNNGAYGRRMCQIAEAYGLNYIEYRSAPDKALDLVLLEAIIQKSARKISHLAVVHNETTTGLLNDIGSIGRLCKKYHIQMIVDAMSSFGAIPIDMDAMNISYLAASSNKNLQGMAGVGFVIARKADLETTEPLKPRNFYLHLYGQYKYFSGTKQMRFTPPVQTLYALKQAIIETNLEGVQERYKRYSKSWGVLIDGITSLGLTHLVKKEHHSRIITAIIEPNASSYDFEEMHDYFYRHGYTIYPGKLDGQNTFRVANIGDITYKDMELFVSMLEQYLISIGYCTERREIHGDSQT